MEGSPYFVKIIVVGESGVGKTSLLNKYCYGQFNSKVEATVGCDFNTKLIQDLNGTGKVVTIQLWDVAGQERFRSVSKIYFRGALGCIVVCDITNEESLKAAIKWKELTEDSTGEGNIKIPILLVQNKTDLLERYGQKEPFMELEYVKKFAKEHGFCDAIQTSAKESQNLSNIFEYITSEIINKGLIECQENSKSPKINSQYQNQKPQQLSSSKANEYEKKKCQC